MNEENRPHPKNVPGPFYVVDECCTACGVPMVVAPELFAYDERMQCFVRRRNVDSNEAKMITTLGIWGAVASILIFSGIFKLTGDVLTFVIMVAVPGSLAGAAAAATKAVWARPTDERSGVPSSDVSPSAPTR